MRAAGHEMEVLILQFIKGGWAYGELLSVEKMEHVAIKTLGSGFTWNKESLEEDRRLAAAGWEEAVAEISGGRYKVIVLDELNVVLSYGLLPLETVLRVLKQRPPEVHIVVTGRNAPVELIEIADMVAEMKQVKHPFHDQGIRAQKGVEF
jgi:cob(I)alamin adenosyltransferase